MYTPAASAAWMIHWPASTSTWRPLRVMLTVSPAPLGSGGVVPTALSVSSGRRVRRTGTDWPPGLAVPLGLGAGGPETDGPDADGPDAGNSDTGQPPGEPVGRERAAALAH